MILSIDVAAVADFVYTVVLIVGLSGFAVWAIREGNRRVAELELGSEELHELEVDLEIAVERERLYPRSSVRIVDPPPYDYELESD